MVTPAELLTRAEELLEGLQVDEDSVSDLEQLRGGDRGEDAVEADWTDDSLRVFVGELGKRYQAQAKVIVAAAANGGFVERATVYELAGYPGDRQLKGFTRPVSTVSRELEDQGVLTGEEPFLLHTIYGSVEEPSWATGFRIPDEAVPLLREIYEGGALWPDSHRHGSEDADDDPKGSEHGGGQ
jgi:hypothetical protein